MSNATGALLSGLIALCPQCASSRTESFGTLPMGITFAGVVQDPPLAGGILTRCNECFLTFRSPILLDEDYDRLYEAGSPTVWRSQSRRRDHEFAATALRESVRSGSVLDVGCFDGAFLRRLPRAFKRFGVEPGPAAAALAAAQSVVVLGKGLADIPSETRFDAVVAIDVIEHVPNPLAFLEKCTSFLAPGGVLILSTGDAGSPAFGLFKQRFWYAAPPEHIRFVGAKWYRLHSTALGLEVLRLTPFRHLSRSWLAEVCLVPYRLVQMGLAILRQPAGSRRLVVGWPGLFTDHILAVFRKPA